MIRTLAILIGVLVVLAGCGNAQSQPSGGTPGAPAATASSEETETAAESPAAGAGGDITIAITSEPVSLDNGMHTDLMSAVVGAAVSDALIWTGPEGEYRPALATAWEVGEDEVTWTFELREGVTFTNGEPFNADVVKYTIERIMDPANESPASATVTSRIESVNVVDDLTVEIVTDGPYPGLLADLIWPVMVPPAYAEEVGVDEFGQAPIGLGAMKFVEWVPGSHITLEANEDYWGGAPAIDTLTYRPITEESTGLSALRAGEVDIMLGLSPENAEQLEGESGLEVEGFESVRQVYFALDTLNAPFDNVLVRQAMNHAIDVDALIEAMLNGRGARIAGAFWPQTVGFRSDIEPYSYDPDRARELLAEAGYADGFTFPLHVTLSGEGIINTQGLAEAIQGYLSEVGIQAELTIHENATYWEMYNAVEFAGGGYIASWGAGQVDGRHLNPLFHSETRGYYYQNPETDAAIIECISTVDQTARAEACGELQARLHEEAPWVFLYAQPQLYGMAEGVEWEGTREDFMIHPSEILVTE